VGGAGVGVVEVEGAGGAEEQGISAGRAVTFLAPLKFTVKSSTF